MPSTALCQGAFRGSLSGPCAWLMAGQRGDCWLQLRLLLPAPFCALLASIVALTITLMYSVRAALVLTAMYLCFGKT